MSIYKSTDGRKVYVDCDCGCGDSLKLEMYDWNEVEVVGIRMYSPNVHRFRQKISRIIHSIFNRNYHIIDVLLRYDEWKEFVDYVNKIDKQVDVRHDPNEKVYRCEPPKKRFL